MKKIIKSLVVMIALATTVTSFAQIRITGVDPNQNLVFIRNYGSAAVDITNHILSSKLTNFTVGSMTVIAGTPSSLGSMQTAWVQGGNLDAAGADLALYTPGTTDFNNTANLLDFVQWKSGGHGRESVAVSKGIWTAGDFVCGDPSYTYAGNGGSVDFGVNHWNGVNCTSSIDENDAANNIVVYPNPTTDVINVSLQYSMEILSYKLVNLLGQTMTENNNNSVSNQFSIDVANLPKGQYFLMVKTKNNVVTKKVVITD